MSMVDLVAVALVQSQDAGAMREAACQPLLAVAGARTGQALEKKVRLRVRRCRIDGDWAFLWAEMQDLHGRPISYVGTTLAEPARQGFLSRDYAALMRRTGEGWSIRADAIGPTDEAWADWPERFGAPATLFAR